MDSVQAKGPDPPVGNLNLFPIQRRHPLAESTPTAHQWRRLYQAAIRVKELAPWEWMEETDILGVQNPETDEIGFVSVMGMLGEHLSLAVYLGPKGLYGFWEFEETGAQDPAEFLLKISHLQASFEDRSILTDKDRKQIKELGFKFRGRQAWPMFRSYRPGWFPWYLEAPEVRFLTVALEQALDVTRRYREDPELLTLSGADDYLVRVSKMVAGALVWEDQIATVLPPDPESISITMDVDLLETVQRLPMSPYTLEMDLFLSPIPIGERGERPYFPYMLLTVESDSGMVLGSELLAVESTLEAMYGQVPLEAVQQIARFNMRPQQIHVRSALLYQLLELLVDELGFELQHRPSLPSLDSAKEFLLSRFI